MESGLIGHSQFNDAGSQTISVHRRVVAMLISDV